MLGLENIFPQSASVAENPDHKPNVELSELMAKKEAARNIHREWCRRNLDRRRASNLKYRIAHPERVRASNQLQYSKNRKARLEAAKRYYKEHKAERNAYSSKRNAIRYAKNRDKILAQTKRYAKLHPEIRSKIWAKRSMAKINCPVVDRVIKHWKSNKTFVCYYCRGRFPISKLQVDHVLALAKGGTHSSENIAKSCQKCNCSKSAKPIKKLIVSAQLFLL